MMATQPQPDPKRNKNLVEPDAEDQAVEPEVIQGGERGDGVPRGNLKPVSSPQPGPAPPTKKPLQSVPGGGQGDGKPQGNLASVPAQPPANKPPVDTDAIDEPLPDELPEQEDQDDNRPDPRDFEEKDRPEPDEDRGGEKKDKGEKGEGSKGGEKGKEGKVKGPESGPKPGGTAPSGGGLVGGAEKGLDMQGVGAGAEQAGKQVAAQAGKGIARAAVMNPYVLAGVLAFVLIFGGLMAFVVPAGMAGTRSGGGGGSEQNQQAGGGTAVSGDVQSLARQILQSNKITVEGNPRSSLQAAAQGKCSPTPSTGGCVKLDPRLLKALLEVSQKRPFTITSLTTGDHTSCSNHYEGRAADIVPADNSLLAEFRKFGATELLGPGDPGHDDHIHVAWDGPNKNCE